MPKPRLRHHNEGRRRWRNRRKSVSFCFRLRLTYGCGYTNDVETSAKSRCFRSGGTVRHAAGDGMRVAQCSDDSGRAGVLQEDGGTVWGHGDGEIPSLLSGNRHAW